MTFRVSTYFAFLAALGVLACALARPALLLPYTLAAAGILLPLYVLRVSRQYFYVLIFTAGAIWISHLVRPLVSSSDDLILLYPIMRSVTDAQRAAVLLDVALYAMLLIGGVAAGLVLFQPLGRDDVTAGPDDAPLLLRAHRSVLLILGALLAARLFLLLVLGVGRKGVPIDPRVGFLIQFFPDELVFGVGVLLLARYGRLISRQARGMAWLVILGYSGVLLVGGSKAFFARILLAAFVYYLAARGDFRLRLRTAVAIGAATVLVLAVSFPFATALRLATRTSGLGLDAAATAVSTVRSSLRPEQLGIAADLVTRRLAGYDGMIVVHMEHNEAVAASFHPVTTVKQVASRLIPGFRLQEMTQGKAVSVHYARLPESLQHAGALGFFGSARLTAGRATGLFIFLFGLAWGAFFRLTSRVRSLDAQFLLQYIGAYVLLRWLLSGNADDLLAMFIIQIVQLAAYAVLLHMTHSVVRTTMTREATAT